ncbi:hypothetical protein [Saccharopolyspora endophytica]|uniref:Uncharacterized protein n=1 Tax=Saccharopolyspora endophytica TaxID=543886 RepID=A0A0C5BVS6_9PSEU|nr:hypothetical protein [Saccharopolyspora endophytica]AJM87325.1 hypothetical protein pCM32.12 [Saccharopolyspora endophytica]MBQ0928830.1 hypothetical protein [Saccharopolyspora endophytica]
MTTRPSGGDVIDAYLTSNDTGEGSGMQSYHWTAENQLETDPAGITPLADVSPGDYDEAAKSDIWTTGTGRHVTRAAIPNPDRLAAIRRVADRVVSMQDDDVLIEAMTEDELAEARALGRQRREARRGHEHDMLTADLAEEQEAAKHEQAMRTRHRQAQERIAEAKERQQRATDPSYRLVLLNRLRTWLPLAALLPGLASVVLGTLNAGSRLNVISPDTRLVNWLIEPMFSVGVLVILVAQWLGAVPSALHSLKQAGQAHGIGAKLKAAAANGFFLMELLLFFATVVLQIGIHYIGPDPASDIGPLVWLFVPLGLLISMALVPAVSTRLTAAFVGEVAAAENRLTTPTETRDETGFSTGSDLHREKAGETSPGKPENPARYGSKTRAREEFWQLVTTGDLDPATEKVNAIAKRLNTRWENAREFVAEWREHAA